MGKQPQVRGNLQRPRSGSPQLWAGRLQSPCLLRALPGAPLGRLGSPVEQLRAQGPLRPLRALCSAFIRESRMQLPEPGVIWQIHFLTLDTPAARGLSYYISFRDTIISIILQQVHVYSSQVLWHCRFPPLNAPMKASQVPSHD